jgi:hypothetical protein
MSLAAQILTIVIALGAFFLVLYLVRRRKLKERFAAIWLVVGVGMVVLALARPLLDRLSTALGIQSGITTVFLIAVLVILGIQLQLSVSVSRLEERLRDLAEFVALGETTSPADGRSSGVEPGPSIKEGDNGENSSSV